MVNLASSDNTVATVDATGLITPLKAGTTNITFTSEAVENKYNAVTTTVTLALTVTLPVVATPALPASGAFVDSKEIAITCDTEGASVKYSTDNGATWIDYTESFTITETTTLQAKAVKENYSDSEVATATYTKITLVDQTEVASTSTWDWSKFGTNEIKLTDTTTPAKNDEVVLANAVDDENTQSNEDALSRKSNGYSLWDDDSEE